MTTLEYTIYGFRRGWQLSRTFLFAGAFAAAVVAGVFTASTRTLLGRVTPLFLFAIWGVVFAVKAHRRFKEEQQVRGLTDSRLDLELGLLLVVATHAVVQTAGGLDSMLYPINLVLVAFLVVYTPPWIGLTLVAVTVCLELAIAVASPGLAPLVTAASHVAFVVLFAAINLVFTHSEVARLRRKAARRAEADRQAVAADARDFRLTAPACGKPAAAARDTQLARLLLSSVTEVRRAMYHHVDLLKRTMGLHTCLLLWLDPCGERVRILECVTDADNLCAKKLKPGEGAIGAVLQRREPLSLTSLKPGYPGLPYYAGAAPVTDFAAVPVIESGSLRGALCADRRDNRRFSAQEMQTLGAAAESLLTVLTNERVFTQLQKAKSEQGMLLAASDTLSRALSEKQVVNAALEAAGQIAPFDVAAMALVARGTRQVIRQARGSSADELVGVAVDRGSGLAAAALKNRHFLPYRGEFDPAQQMVFSKRTQRLFARMRAALVLPLVAGDEPLGTLSLFSMAKGTYDEEVRTTLQVMGNQLSIALQNARMVRRLEELATTDGLTGLANHRVFQEELEKKLASASRFSKELSVIMCDLDRFKGINDAHGHPAGDTVIRGLAETLRRMVVRDTDLPARYGGEEFAVVCEGTSTVGAVKLAERIRRDLEGQVFHTEKGPIQVTISMGVATFPTHALSKADLVARADAALYSAKKNGRNQVCYWSKERDSRP